jgi:hypothetical protein
LLSGRLTMRDAWTGRLVNAFSLGYCRVAGLRTVELTELE